MKSHNTKKPTKKEAMNLVMKNFDKELKKNYAVALSQGFKMALSTILELIENDKDFDVVGYCNKELNLRKDMDEVLVKMYDKEKKYEI